MKQIRHRGSITFQELLGINYRNTNKGELLTVLETIEAMKVVEGKTSAAGIITYYWKGEGK